MSNEEKNFTLQSGKYTLSVLPVEDELPKYSILTPFNDRKYLTHKVIKFLKSEGFEYKVSKVKVNANACYQKMVPYNFGEELQDFGRNTAFVLVTATYILVNYPGGYLDKDFCQENNKVEFILHYEEFGSFAACYDEMVKRVFKL